jgi:hypothetical protein
LLFSMGGIRQELLFFAQRFKQPLQDSKLWEGWNEFINLIKIENRNVFNLHERGEGGVKLRDSPVTRGRITII